MPPPATVEINAVLGILRLAHKYDVQYLFLRALQHLSVRYGPSSVDDYRNHTIKDHIVYPSSTPLPHLTIIRAVTEVGAMWLLPILYYVASNHTRERLRAAIALGAEERHVRTCIEAHGDLVRSTGKVWSFVSAGGAAGCVDRMECNIARQSMPNWFFDTLWDCKSLTPLDDWGGPDGWDPISAVVCAPCLAHAQENHQELLEEVWDNLPAMFDLPSWEELKAMRAAVMGEEAQRTQALEIVA
ncbi:hypothetical protein B0H13DRAFT_2530127 [Mycena leptocephala]|nr:hypothetical protein B0H13DRAFT_2530127 [Mycena leptocephala]